MEECCFDDLNFRLGQPYLYVHQGDCEHMVIFTDIRLFSPQGDCPLKATYPLLLKTRHRVSTSCFMCKLKTAKWMVFGNDRLPDEPFLFCQECMLQFNYTKDGQKIGQFSAYSFLDESALLWYESPSFIGTYLIAQKFFSLSLSFQSSLHTAGFRKIDTNILTRVRVFVSILKQTAVCRFQHTIKLEECPHQTNFSTLSSSQIVRKPRKSCKLLSQLSNTDNNRW